MSEISENDLQKRIEVLEKQLESTKYWTNVFIVTVVIIYCGLLLWSMLSFITSTSDQPLRTASQTRDFIIHWFMN